MFLKLYLAIHGKINVSRRFSSLQKKVFIEEILWYAYLIPAFIKKNLTRLQMNCIRFTFILRIQ